MPKERKLRASEQKQIAEARAVLSNPKTSRLQKKQAERNLARLGVTSPKVKSSGLRHSPGMTGLSALAGAAPPVHAEAAKATAGAATMPPPPIKTPAAVAVALADQDTSSPGTPGTAVAKALETLSVTATEPDATTEP